jgi:hypothetical protein
MSNGATIRRTVAAAAILTALSLSAAQASDVAYFWDVRPPNGHTRTLAAKSADARACGATAAHTFGKLPAFTACMSRRGWALDHWESGAWAAAPWTSGQQPWSSAGSSASSSSASNDDLVRSNDDLNRAAQPASDSVNAVSQTIADASAAAAAQAQNDLIRMNEPLQQN